MKLAKSKKSFSIKIKFLSDQPAMRKILWWIWFFTKNFFFLLFWQFLTSYTFGIRKNLLNYNYFYWFIPGITQITISFSLPWIIDILKNCVKIFMKSYSCKKKERPLQYSQGHMHIQWEGERKQVHTNRCHLSKQGTLCPVLLSWIYFSGWGLVRCTGGIEGAC